MALAVFDESNQIYTKAPEFTVPDETRVYDPVPNQEAVTVFAEK
jgi:hypothetical protein